MADIVSKEKRSRMMSGIRSKNTKPELIIRKALFRKGYRYRLHPKRMPGRPDFILPKYRVAVFVNGCFWHLHDCHLFKWPSTRRQYWQKKLQGNKERDELKTERLLKNGWRVLIIWECAIRGKKRIDFDEVIERTENFIKSSNSDIKFVQIEGNAPNTV